MRYFRRLAILGVVFILSATFGTASGRDVVDRIVAVVNGEVVTLFELNQRFRPFVEQFQGQELGEVEKRMLLDGKGQLLDRMIDEILLRQEAQRLDVTVTDLEVQTQMRQLRDRAGLSERQFQEQLTLQGLTQEQYERRLRDDMLRHRLLGFMVRRKVVVTSDEIRAFYEANRGEFAQQRRVRLGLILFENQTTAEEVLTKIQAGDMSFAEAAGRYSRGPGAEQGGDMGIFAWGDLSPNWREAVEPLRVGGISNVVVIQDRPAVIKLLDEEAGEPKALADVEEQIREKLMEPLLDERYDVYMESLRNRALIDVRL